MAEWEPGASRELLQLRADLLARVRQFFRERRVLEVETPLLYGAAVTDLHLSSLGVRARLQGKVRDYYLQTSPEFAMKRLLCAGSGAIYQIAKAFRQDESSARHNPEFTLLEWYQPGYAMADLMDEVAQLLRALLDVEEIPRISYRDLFLEHLGFDPHGVSDRELAALAHKQLDISGGDLSATDYLQLLLSHCIEPRLPPFCFVYDYPREQCSLAAVEQDSRGEWVARRFELYAGGMELANGYRELTDAREQRRRFEEDLRRREAAGLAAVAIDEKLLAAMAEGLPDCAGVALGFDRLLMLAAGVDSITEVLAFPIHRV